MLNQNTYGSFTVFSPTDQAFEDFFKTRGGVEAGIKKLKQNNNELQKVIRIDYKSLLIRLKLF